MRQNYPSTRPAQKRGNQYWIIIPVGCFGLFLCFAVTSYSILHKMMSKSVIQKNDRMRQLKRDDDLRKAQQLAHDRDKRLETEHKEFIDKAIAHPEVQKVLGTPIHVGTIVQTHGDSDKLSAHFESPLSGPKGTGTLQWVIWTRSGKPACAKTEFKSGEKSIDLLEKADDAINKVERIPSN